MAVDNKKARYSPIEVAKLLKVSPAKFFQYVNEGDLPKGRIGEDGKRYYTEQDVDFIRRQWHSKTTGHFIMFTLPTIIIGVFLIVLTFFKISSQLTRQTGDVDATPTPRVGYAVPPREIWEPGTPWPTRPPHPTATPKPYVFQDFSSRYNDEDTGEVPIFIN